MLRTTWTRGRRGAVIGASAAVVCLGAALAACGGGGAEGYVATGPVGGAPQPSGTAVTPTGGVTFVPLDGPRKDSGAAPVAEGNSGTGSGTSTGAPAAAPDQDVGSPGGGAKSGRTTTAPASPTATPSRTAPAGPAVLTWGDPARKATDKRWCEDVTLDFANSGGSAVRSGSVTFGTHIIGALGIDWGTVESTVGLPVPIGAGARKEKTWTVCVDAWRVPLGMHIETRDVTVQWK
ncbi:hypothetical protein ACFY1U_18030 [Streptomyces sp. NPDC001351]|uniref:hypothetical protein n=1 Tax=Streptomyces sp. NPDC001351 TaxID=3364564 RepID=UPI0036A6DCB6